MTSPRGFARFLLLIAGVALPLVGFFSHSSYASTVESQGQINCRPCDFQFGSVSIGQSSAVSGTISNNGSQAIVLQYVSRTDSQFSGNLRLPMTLNPGQTAHFLVTFAPTHSGQTDASLAIVNKASQSLTLTVHGIGTNPGVLALNPTSLNFGDVQVGSTATLSSAFERNCFD